MTDGHGDDIWRYDTPITGNFSTNIRQDCDHSALKKYMASRLDFIDSYPAPEPVELERKLAAISGVDEGNVMVSAGATDAIYSIAALLPKGSVAGMAVPTFAEYGDACRIAGHDILTAADYADVVDRSDIVWICNPDNPTGRVWAAEDIMRCVENNPGKLFVIDRAYASYTDNDGFPSVKCCAGYRNMVLLHSLTKDYCVPGLRVGYVTAQADLISSLKARRMPWSINQLSLDAAMWLVEKGVPSGADDLRSEARRMAAALAEMGVEVTPSRTNFFLCRLPGERAAMDLKDYLACNCGLLIRDASNFAGLTKQHFRIAAQTPELNDALLKAIGEWIG